MHRSGRASHSLHRKGATAIYFALNNHLHKSTQIMGVSLGIKLHLQIDQRFHQRTELHVRSAPVGRGESKQCDWNANRER